ncbi:hypothetical protein Hanom_Chr11g01051731 [Helianthus anomalus]
MFKSKGINDLASDAVTFFYIIFWYFFRHIFIALASSAGLLMLLDKRPQIGQWRCLSSTSLKK